MKQFFILKGIIDDNKASEVIKYLLDCEEHGRTAILIIRSTSGRVTSAMAVYDTIQSLHTRVITVAAEENGGMAALILAAGTQGFRYICQDTQCYGLGNIHSQQPDNDADMAALMSAGDKITSLYYKEYGGKPYDNILDVKVANGIIFRKKEDIRYERIINELRKIQVII